MKAKVDSPFTMLLGQLAHIPSGKPYKRPGYVHYAKDPVNKAAVTSALEQAKAALPTKSKKAHQDVPNL